ncbi:MAG: hypothetical protein PHQ23_06630 [Candidatus Wallbacteria bacterium]|nr:hypothetical protein [Candidatus Wallbacteria bacterium]
MTTQKIDIIPAGITYSFNCYKTEAKPVEEIYRILKTDDLSADLEKLKPGFFKIDKYQGAISSSFAFPYKEDIEILREGSVRKLEVPRLETIRLIAMPGYLLLSGRSVPAKCALQVFSQYISIAGGAVKITQEKMLNLTEMAAVINTVQFRNIPHSEIEKVTLSGELEEIFALTLPLREAEIGGFAGIFNTPFGIRSLKFSTNGRVQIVKSKKLAISLELLEWVVNAVAG